MIDRLKCVVHTVLLLLLLEAPVRPPLEVLREVGVGPLAGPPLADKRPRSVCCSPPVSLGIIKVDGEGG